MTIQISISGHANGETEEEQKNNETQFIEHLKGAVNTFRTCGHEVFSATFSSQHNGTGEL
jgi:hypothetical protein